MTQETTATPDALEQVAEAVLAELRRQAARIHKQGGPDLGAFVGGLKADDIARVAMGRLDEIARSETQVKQAYDMTADRRAPHEDGPDLLERAQAMQGGEHGAIIAELAGEVGRLRNYEHVVDTHLEPYHCGSDCPCYSLDEGPDDIFTEFPECWQLKDARVGARPEMLSDAEARSAMAALEPFARFSQAYPDAKDDAVLSLQDARCPVSVGDCHKAKAVYRVLSRRLGEPKP